MIRTYCTAQALHQQQLNGICMCVYACVCMHVCVCAYLCVWSTGREYGSLLLPLLRLTCVSVLNPGRMSLRTLTGYDLTLSDLNRVYNLLFRVKAKWKEIGLQLGVDPYSLESIQSEVNFRDDGQRLMQMLSEWLRNVTEPRPSWPRVVDALRSEPVHEWNVAERVKRRQCPSYVEPESSLWPPPRKSLVPVQNDL